jgi:hypothetical protein
VTPLNDISHIVWDEEAFAAKGISLRYTGTALALNASANWGWALLYELFFAQSRERGESSRALAGGLGVAALAYVVDYHLVPKRLTPGFEHHLSGRSLLFIYLGSCPWFGAASVANKACGEMNTFSPHSPPDSRKPQAPRANQIPAQASHFPAFRHRDFRLFWAGNLVSLSGTWAQQTAQGWLVRSLTPDPLLLSAVAACGSVPVLLLTLYAGAVADRVDKRRALLLTNALAMVLAVALGVLVWMQVVQVWHVALIALALGAVNAFDIPARQSFNVEMVGREDLPNAIALNSSAFNAARVFGPATGGILLQRLGPAGCFFVNALSFGALLWSLSRMGSSTRLASEVAPRLERHSAIRTSRNLEGFTSCALTLCCGQSCFW